VDQRLVDLDETGGVSVARISLVAVRYENFVRQSLECSAVRLAAGRVPPAEVIRLRHMIGRQRRLLDSRQGRLRTSHLRATRPPEEHLRPAQRPSPQPEHRTRHHARAASATIAFAWIVAGLLLWRGGRLVAALMLAFGVSWVRGDLDGAFVFFHRGRSCTCCSCIRLAGRLAAHTGHGRPGLRRCCRGHRYAAVDCGVRRCADARPARALDRGPFVGEQPSRSNDPAQVAGRPAWCRA
jgi:hypothetical protein